MHDIRWIRDDPEAFDAAMARRGVEPLSARVIEMDAKRREAQTEAQELQTRRNELSKRIGQLKSKGEDAQALMDEVAAGKDAQAAAEAAAKEAGDQVDELLSGIPNALDADVPDGADEDDNRELRAWGEPRQFDFDPKEHDDLGEALGLMDFERAAGMSGARFVILTGALARLERAIGDFMLDIQTQEFGYTEVSPPLLVRDHALFGTGQLPKFGDDLFKTDEGRWMIPTAEVPLTNMAAGEILDEEDLPLRYTARTPCFRSEAGASGKDTKGMIRQHQFTKVELVSIAHPDKSAEEHERMTECAEAILRRLELPYRTMVLCSGDTGFSARKTYDIEVWLPGQGRYREISSCSNCGDFQARRMKARYRPGEGQGKNKGTWFVHTLNGSGLAVGRTLIAVMENGQRKDGSIVLPQALQPYMNGREVLSPDA
ncbi:MAG: serine--tRNA ligase [Rhodospirillales bacterium]|nr:serine--tRNA ligase [Rhodospirillales bacterium]